MSVMEKPIRSKRRDMEVGDRIVMIEPVSNGLIELKPMDTGSIIYLQNQVKATVWFRHIGDFIQEPIVQALEVDISYNRNGKLDGLTVELQRGSFATKYQPSSHKRSEFYVSMDEVTVDEEKMIDVPFFVLNEQYRQPSSSQKRNANGEWEQCYQYELWQLINIINEGFNNWVEHNKKTRKVTKSEKESGEYPSDWDTRLTDESCELILAKKHETELAFAKATGIYYEFDGGLLWG